jgi:hypothetical protein
MTKSFSLEVQVGDFSASSASFSDDGLFRYSLSRRWAASGPIDLWIAANPSKAGADGDDHSVRKMIGFSKRLGSAGLDLVNMHAFIATAPSELVRAHRDGVDIDGPENERRLAAALCSTRYARRIVAWGDCLGAIGLPRARSILIFATRMGIELVCLGTTASGNPRHPLRVGYATKLRPWRPTA